MGLAFGYVAQETDRVKDVVAWIGRRVGWPLEAAPMAVYRDLARAMRHGDVAVGWLPPIVYMDLERRGLVRPIVSAARRGKGSYRAVMIVRADSSIEGGEQLAGTRVAWVDPWSASGYVLPRLELSARGVDPVEVFARQRFLGSHGAAVRSVLDGENDVCATFAHFDAEGNVVRGGWSDLAAEGAARVVVGCGEIPGDVIAAGAFTDDATCDAIRDALVASVGDPTIEAAARAAFGADELRPGLHADYAAFRAKVKLGFSRGLIDGVESG